jgi:hypothetical protein
MPLDEETKNKIADAIVRGPIAKNNNAQPETAAQRALAQVDAQVLLHNERNPGTASEGQTRGYDFIKTLKRKDTDKGSR